MKTLFSIIVIVAQSVVSTFAQDSRKVDSLNSILSSQNDEKIRAKTYVTLGEVYQGTENYAKSLQSYEKALEYSKLLDTGTVIFIGRQIGRLLALEGKYPQALEYLLQALRLCEAKHSLGGMSECYRLIGNLYGSQKDFERELSYYQEALKIAKNINDTLVIALTQYNMGGVYVNLNRYQDAIKSFFVALKLFEKSDAPDMIADCLTGLGEAHEKLDEVYTGLGYHRRAKEIFEKLEIESGVGTVAFNIATCYQKLGKLSDAKTNAEIAEKIGQRTGDIELEMDAKKILAPLYASFGLFDNAYRAESSYHRLKDSLFNAENANRISFLQFQYESEKRDSEKKLREIELQRQQEIITEKQERRILLQYLAIFGIILLAIMIALLSRKIFSLESANAQAFVRLISFTAVVMIIEFAILFLDPVIDKYTAGTPLWKMFTNVAIAIAVTPIHSLIESRLQQANRNKQ